MDRPDGSPTAVDVVQSPTWADIEGRDRSLLMNQALVNYNDAFDLLYMVPAGKTFYLTDYSAFLWASAAGNAELNQMCAVEIVDATTGVTIVSSGGNGGVVGTLKREVTIPGGDVLMGTLYNGSNHGCRASLCMLGYEV